MATTSNTLRADSVLLTIEEIGQVISQKGQPAETLSNIVELISRRFGTDVCSVYLLEPDRVTLVLAATIGLRPESVGKIRMSLGEGLAGLVAEELRPIMVENAPKHPRYKYFREVGRMPSIHSLGFRSSTRG
jgi:signal transduction protein with GAF and PtsI domain